MEVPHYQEISVKNLYPDAMKDPVLSKYLPSKEQVSNKLPERDFFFGVVCTLRRQYVTDIIEEANKKRFKVGDDDPKKQGIAISDAWMEELLRHPYHSSKYVQLTSVGKAGTGIFLMKERAKVYKAQSSRTKHQLSKRLQAEEEKEGSITREGGAADKRMKRADGQPIPVPASSQQSMIQPQKPK